MFLDDKNWTLDFNSFDPETEKNSEALCTVGNGYMGTRGAFAESVSSEAHYPGTYIAGLYNILESEVAGKIIENEDFVNCPNWTALTFKIDDGEWFDVSKVTILEYHKQINFKHGFLVRRIRFEDEAGRITLVETLRCISMHSMHLAGIRYIVTPQNYSGTICIRSALDGDIINEGVDRYKQLNSLHLAPVKEWYKDDAVFLSVITNQSHITIEQAAQNRFFVNGKEVNSSSEYITRDRYIAELTSIPVKSGEQITVDKMVSIFTSRDQGVPEPLVAARETLENAHDFDAMISEHRTEWEQIWKKADIQIDGDDEVQKILRFHAYHMLVTASKHNKTIDADIPARGLHGEAYRGHIFWDELFIFPFYNLHFPGISKALLMYRYHRLDAARAYAAEYGYKGAMFPWQSGSSGKEETQIIHLNPISGEWGPDYSSLQRHVSLAIAYNVWMYYQATDDNEFLYQYGAELLFEIARFWESKTEYNESTGRYEIHKVMGPNEFHEKQPGSEEGGVKDNAYTNVLVAWLMHRCIECQKILSGDELAAVETKIHLTAGEKEKWQDITQKMHVKIKDGIISQYDGFLDLKELDWDAYRKKHGDIHRMDRLMKADGLSPDEYQLSKQADLLMLFYVLPPEEIGRILQGMGYHFDDEMIKKNYDYYLARTSHGSTLSLVVHAHVAALMHDSKISIEWFKKALTADISDIQGGTVKEGIHTGLMAGTIFLFLSSYAGLDFFGKVINFKPELPGNWKHLKFNITFRSVDYHIQLTSSAITILADNTDQEEVTIKVFNKEYTVKRGKEEKIVF